MKRQFLLTGAAMALLCFASVQGASADTYQDNVRKLRERAQRLEHERKANAEKAAAAKAAAARAAANAATPNAHPVRPRRSDVVRPHIGPQSATIPAPEGNHP